MKILRLKSENVQRIRMVEINPNGTMVVVGGKNGNGKTSLLDSIMMALGGKRCLSERPVREGADKATVELELDEDFIIRRVIQANGNSEVQVKSKDGRKYLKPQDLLDSFVGKFAFDPLAFRDMKPAQQAELLRNLVGIDFREVDQERTQLFQRRTEVNRTARDLDGQLQALPYFPDAPKEELPVEALMAKVEQVSKLTSDRERMVQKQRDLERRMNHRTREIEQLQQKLKLLRDEQRDDAEDLGAVIESIKTIEIPDSSQVKIELDKAREVSKQIQANARYQHVAALLEKTKEQSAGLSERIEALDREKAETLANVPFPVPGLSFDEAAGVTFNALPFSVASDAEKLRISCAIGLALNPKLKILLIRNGSLLDEDSLQLLGQLAAEHDAQIWLERVGDGEEVGIVIEDGSVVEDRTQKALQAV